VISRALLVVSSLALLAGCSKSDAGRKTEAAAEPVVVNRAASEAAAANPLPGMPPVQDPTDIYAADRPNALVDTVKDFPARVYVPNTISNDVYVIDQATLKVTDHFKVGRLPQHVTPSFDLKTLWALNDKGNSLTHIDPKTGKARETIKVLDPYNMYYTPDGKYALVVAEQRMRLEWYDAQTMKFVKELWVPCKGIDHMDFSANGRYLIASCEFGEAVVKVDVEQGKLIGRLPINPPGMPQDVKLSPDGTVFYVADMHSNGVHLIDGENLKELGHIETGKGAHGLYVSRDSKTLYISNREEGSISLLDLPTRKLRGKWEIPGGGSPDMGGVSADGKVLWLSGRFHGEVYAIDTTDGHLLARIPVGKGPHGLCVYPQPGRYSLGHTGVFR
jgi:YVTN family beta-propeller protein